METDIPVVTKHGLEEEEVFSDCRL